jgi:hypothetical protein
MRGVKARTGKWYVEDVAKLLKVGGIVVSAETLRKMLKWHTPLLDNYDLRAAEDRKILSKNIS